MATSLKVATIATAITVISGCDSLPSDLDGQISDNGASIFFEAVLPSDSTTVYLVSSVYDNGQPEPLIGGDLIQITTETGQIYLSNENYRENFYAGQLPLSNANGDIVLEIIHDAQASRAERWYPTDEVLVDTEGSSLVGYSVTVTMPDGIEIIAPQPGITYTSRTDQIPFEWTGEAGDTLTLLNYAECYSKNNDDMFWVAAIDIPDTQAHSVTIGELIPVDEVLETAGNVQNVLLGFLELTMGTILEVMTFGLYEPEEISISDFELEYCTLELTLYRRKAGTLGEGVEGGAANGTRSDTITVEYRP